MLWCTRNRLLVPDSMLGAIFFEFPGDVFSTIIGSKSLQRISYLSLCNAPKSEGPLIIHQPTESLWISCNSIPRRCVPFTWICNLTKIGHSLLCMGSSTQNPNYTIIQSHDLSGAQYNTMITSSPFRSKN